MELVGADGLVEARVERRPVPKRHLAKSRPEKLAEMQALYTRLTKEFVTLPVTGSATLKGAKPGQRYRR